MGNYPTRAQKIKEIAIRERIKYRRIQKNIESSEQEKKIKLNKKSRSIALRIWIDVIKPSLQKYMMMTSENYGHCTRHWGLELCANGIAIFSVFAAEKTQFLHGPNRNVFIGQGNNIILGHIIEICEDYLMLNGFNTRRKEMVISILPQSTRPQIKDMDPVASIIYNNLSGNGKLVEKDLQEQIGKQWAKEKRNQISKYLTQTAHLGAACVDIIYNVAGDYISMHSSINVKPQAPKLWELGDDLKYYNLDYPKINIVKSAMEYWMEWLKNNLGFEDVSLLPISHYRNLSHYGIQIRLFEPKDIQ